MHWVVVEMKLKGQSKSNFVTLQKPIRYIWGLSLRTNAPAQKYLNMKLDVTLLRKRK